MKEGKARKDGGEEGSQARNEGRKPSKKIRESQ